MEEQRQIIISNHDILPCVSSPTSASQLEEPGQTEVHSQQEDQQQSHNMPMQHCQWLLSLVFQRFNNAVTSLCLNDTRNDVWSCLIVMLTFFFFGSMIMILGLYGSFNLQLSPNCSFLIETNPFFVHSIKAQQIYDQTAGPMLYGFHESPVLDVETTWSQNHIAYVEPNFHKKWAYYLNAGSRIDISYDLKFPSSASLFLVIAQGKESLLGWIHTPSYPNSTTSWNIIYGSGKITQEIKESDTYFVAVGNLNLQTAEINLNITIKSLLYNTSNAHFKCLIRNRVCIFNVILLKPNVAVLTSPGPAQVQTDDDNRYIQVSFGPQWITYFVGSCMLVVLILALFRYYDQSQSTNGDEVIESQGSENVANREPLLSSENYEHMSLGSSYDSIPSDEDEGLEEKMIVEGSSKQGEINSNNTHRLCAICFDASRECFFLPCGHCAACFNCGSRISEEAGNCPICRKKIKKVRKIFSV